MDLWDPFLSNYQKSVYIFNYIYIQFLNLIDTCDKHLVQNSDANKPNTDYYAYYHLVFTHIPLFVFVSCEYKIQRRIEMRVTLPQKGWKDELWFVSRIYSNIFWMITYLMYHTNAILHVRRHVVFMFDNMPSLFFKIFCTC